LLRVFSYLHFHTSFASHAWSWSRDLDRLTDVRRRLNECPLGSGALAGHTFKINRNQLAKNLGFDRESGNSIDATSDRDFVLEFLAYSTIAGVHLSRLAEDLIIWSTAEFAFVK
jgi:argininosuccinate lyase